MLPLTLTAVRPISISGSIEINKPASPIGKFIAERTKMAAKVAPPPTPATPKELIATVTISVKIKVGSNGSIPTVGAIMTASIAG